MTTTTDIEVRVVTEADTDRMMAFLHKYYYPEEPLTVGSGGPAKPDAEDEEFLRSNVKHGTCLFAIQRTTSTTTNTDGTDDGEIIVGALVAGPKHEGEDEHIFAEATRLKGTKWGRILYMLGCVERDANVYKRYGVTKAVHAHALGVDTELRGRAIGARLINYLMELSRQLGYPVVVLDCTSVYSARLVEKLNFELINERRYSDHVDDAGKQTIQPPAPHESVRTYAMRL